MTATERISESWDFANAYHSGQFRKHGNLPYMCHISDVLKKISSWGIEDPTTMCAAIMHDTIEDTEATFTDVYNNTYDVEIARIVEELTYVDGFDKQQYINSFEVKSIESFVIKIADRICNVKDFLMSDPQYAVKYLNKARAFSQFLQNRKKEIITKYGESAFIQMNLDFHRIA